MQAVFYFQPFLSVAFLIGLSSVDGVDSHHNFPTNWSIFLMKLDKQLAVYKAWSLEQQGFRAEIYDTGERLNGYEIHQIRVWVENEIHLIRKNRDYHQFRCKYILNARKEHHLAIWDLIDSLDEDENRDQPE